jgi:fructose-1,6-bisphosphatase/inositol monophosphatase family enzyme
MSRVPDIDSVSAIVREVAAAAIMPRFRKLAAGEVSTKEGPHDLLTVADTEAERLLSSRLMPLVPGSVMVGEEACSADPKLLKRLGEAAPAWIVDPIDGTLNFATGQPMFGLMVAYSVAGETLAAWIYDPVNNRMATAARGSGTWIDGRRIALSGPGALDAMHGTIAVRTGERARAGRIAARTDRLASVLILRCAAFEYLALLEGGSHFSFYNRVMPWDHAPGICLVEEAGGYAARLDGQRYRPNDAVQGAVSLLVAVDAAHWRLVNEALIADGT